MKIKKGDLVQVITGKDKGKQGKVIVAYPSRDRVLVEGVNRVKHKLYGKVIRRTSKLKAHDEQNAAGIGDRVLLMEMRPLSATKRWRVVEILEKAK